jgi:LPXTG-motif cell wall-anchored protein
MVKRMAVLAVAFVALMAAPAVAQQYPPGENLITVSDTTPCPGQAVTIAAQTFAAGGAVTVKLGDTVVGTPTADADGKVSVEATVPAGQAQGAVQVSATGPGTDDEPSLTVNAAVEVVACNEAPPPTTPSGGGGGSDLPKTGSDSTMTLVRVGVALAAAGGLLLAVSTKRRRRTGAVPA